jgi:hypothetical protein
MINPQSPFDKQMVGIKAKDLFATKCDDIEVEQFQLERQGGGMLLAQKQNL